MSTLTRVKLTPKDHGREIDPEVFEHSTGEEGYRYEIINGRVYVAPIPNLSQFSLEDWLLDKLKDYARLQPDVINCVLAKSRIFIPTRPRATRPEPDVSAYHEYPHHLPRRQLRWQDISPVLVVEVISEEDPNKDLVRNVELYAEVPSIKEYWVLDPRPDPDQPSLKVFRRRGKGWQKPIDVPYGETYQTPRFLPGFSLLVDPDR
jgi:Uma2 family endonuclease